MFDDELVMRHMRRLRSVGARVRVLAAITVSALLLVGCGTSAAPVGGSVVNASLTDNMGMIGVSGGGMMGGVSSGEITIDRSSVPAGQVTFVVKNNGRIVHELVVIQTDVAHDSLGADPSEAGKVDETGNVGETADMDPGMSKTFTITLRVGHYVLICNKIGHFAAGMHLTFTVN